MYAYEQLLYKEKGDRDEKSNYDHYSNGYGAYRMQYGGSKR